MATYIVRAVFPDPVTDPDDWARRNPDTPCPTVPTAHADVVIDGTLYQLCGLDISSADTLKAGIEAYIAAQQPAPVSSTPEAVAAIIGQALSTNG